MVRVSDDEGLFDRQTVLVLVEVEANTPPALVTSQRLRRWSVRSISLSPASDEDADPVSVQLSQVRPPLSVPMVGATADMDADAEGTFSFQLTQRMTEALMAELRWTVLVTEPGANRRPPSPRRLRRPLRSVRNTSTPPGAGPGRRPFALAGRSESGAHEHRR